MHLFLFNVHTTYRSIKYQLTCFHHVSRHTVSVTNISCCAGHGLSCNRKHTNGMECWKQSAVTGPDPPIPVSVNSLTVAALLFVGMDDDEPSMRFHLGSASRRGYQSDLGQGQGGSSGSGGPYYEQFLGGSTRDGVQQQQQQQQYPTWSTYGSPQESLPAELRAAYNGWNVFGNNADFLFPPADPSPATSRFGYTDEYMTSLSQPESNSGSESGYANLSFSGSMDGLAPNVDLSRASEQGRDIYTDAMNSLQQEPQPSHSGSSQSFVMPSYDLFGSRDVLHDEEVASLTKVQPQPQLRTSPQTVQQKVQQHAAASEPPRHSPVVCGEPRPSYSEVAKNKLPPVHPQKNRKPKKEDPSISFKSDKVPTTGARPGSGEYIPQPSMVPHRKSRGGGKLPNHRVTKHGSPRTQDYKAWFSLWLGHIWWFSWELAKDDRKKLQPAR